MLHQLRSYGTTRVNSRVLISHWVIRFGKDLNPGHQHQRPEASCLNQVCHPAPLHTTYACLFFNLFTDLHLSEHADGGDTSCKKAQTWFILIMCVELTENFLPLVMAFFCLSWGLAGLGTALYCFSVFAIPLLFAFWDSSWARTSAFLFSFAAFFSALFLASLNSSARARASAFSVGGVHSF